MVNQHRDLSPSGEQGVAFLLVVTILTAMVLVALPFAMSMRQGEERTHAVAAQDMASYQARQLADLVKLHLQGTLVRNEQARWSAGTAGARSASEDPSVDSLEEITPDGRFRKNIVRLISEGWSQDPGRAGRSAFLSDRGLDPTRDDRGSIWSVQIEDAQARVHVEGASPFLLGNLFGAALLAEDIDAGNGDISVMHVSAGHAGMPGGFAPDGGIIRIGREVIKYESFDGEVFRNCERGALRQSPLGDNGSAGEHAVGTPVVDYVAYKLATHVISRHPRRLTKFRTLEDLRDIASWGPDGALTADRLEALLPYLTVWGRRETGSGWLAEQLVTNALPDGSAEDGPDFVRVRDRSNPTGSTSYLNPGTIVRLTDGVQTIYNVVANLGDQEGKSLRTVQATLAGRLDAWNEDIKFDGGRASVSAWAPHPININTASREVLFAVMANVHMVRAKTEDNIVTPKLAWELAGRIVRERRGDIVLDAETGLRKSGPFRHAEDYGRWLGNLINAGLLKRAHRAALYLNAVNPNSSRLNFGTTCWCYRTLDVYHIEARVSVNDRAGQQIAEDAVRQVVQIGPGSDSTWTVHSQHEFEERLSMGSGAKWTTTFPYSVVWRDKYSSHVQPGLRGRKGYEQDIYPDDERDIDENLGDVRLEPCRINLPGAQYIDHFDTTYFADGWYTGFEGPYRQKTAGSIMRRNGARPGPFSMSFWWRPFSDANWTAFDCGMERFENRYAVFVTDGDSGQELVFRMCASPLEPKGAEIYVPLRRLDYKQGDWYHIEVACRAEDPSTMRMLIDGVDLGIRRGMTFLTADIAPDVEEIEVESTAQFPERGAIRIGTEVIEYDERTEQGFRACTRGARGTVAGEWTTGTAVHMQGYALPLTVDIMTGKGRIETKLHKWEAVQVIGGEDQVSWTPPDSNYSLTLQGVGPDTNEITLEARPMYNEGGNREGDLPDLCDSFQTEGFALLGCRPLPAGGSQGPQGADDFEPEPPPADGGPFAPPGGVDPGQRDPSDPDDGGDDGGGTTDGGGGDTGGDDGGGGGGGSEIKLAGWEVVHYTREEGSEQFQITRYQQTAFQGEADPYFLITSIPTVGVQYPAYLVPISVHIGSNSSGDATNEYLNPADASHRDVLKRYYPEEEHTAYLFLAADEPEGGYEIVRYNSIDREKPTSGLYFIRDHAIGNLTGHFFRQRTDPPDPPVPADDDGGGDDGTDDATEPPPPTDDGGGTTDDGSIPLPPGGLPPGTRDPGEDDGSGDDGGDDGGGGDGTGGGDDGGDGGGDDGSDDGSPPSSGGGDPGEDPEVGGGYDEDGEPSDDLPQEGSEPGDEGEVPEPENEETGGRENDTVPSNDPPPDPVEPPADSTGGGGDEYDPGGAGPDPVPTAEDAPGQTEVAWPDETREDLEPNGDLWWREPAGPNTARLISGFRGVLGTWDRVHSGGGEIRDTRAQPCFRILRDPRGVIGERAGLFDRITVHTAVEDSNNERFEAAVRWAHAGTGWMALEESPDARVRAAERGADIRREDWRGYPRLLKFPCGEPAEELPNEFEIGRSTISDSDTVTAFLDELHIWRHRLSQPVRVANDDNVTATDETILIAAGIRPASLSDFDGATRDCGVILIDGEAIIYRGAGIGSSGFMELSNCARGQFGTRASPHARGAPAWFVPDSYVAYLQGGLATEAANVPVSMSGNWPSEGLVRVLSGESGESAELIHFTRRTADSLLMPQSLDAADEDRGQGLFRGRFGTTPLSHDDQAVVIFQPSRYWDRYTPRAQSADDFEGVHAHPDSAYLELGKQVRDAWWHGFTWDENLTGAQETAQGSREDSGGSESGLLDLLVVGRFNEGVPWDSEKIVDLRKDGSGGFGQTQDMGKLARDHLFVFDDPGDDVYARAMTGNTLGLETHMAEFRVYFRYKPNAWVSNDVREEGVQDADDERVLPVWWKRTPWFQGIEVTLDHATRVLYHTRPR